MGRSKGWSSLTIKACGPIFLLSFGLKHVLHNHDFVFRSFFRPPPHSLDYFLDSTVFFWLKDCGMFCKICFFPQSICIRSIQTHFLSNYMKGFSIKKVDLFCTGFLTWMNNFENRCVQ